MAKVSIKSIVHTAIVTAFTIATALIWKEVITDTIKFFFPPSEELFYKFVAAVLSTILVVIAIYIILNTESEAEVVIKKLKSKK